jgi:paraquat-inducible protein B
VLNFNDTVRGLNVGAPVELRGIRIGTVTDIQARLAPSMDEVSIPVLVEIEPERTLAADEFAGLSEDEHKQHVVERAAELVERGMRARLQTGNLLTGQLFVELDMFPDAEPATLDTSGAYPEIPTVPRPLSGITSSVSHILERLEKAPLEKVITDLDELILSTRQLVEVLQRETPDLAGEMRRTAEETRAVLVETSTTLEGLRGMTSKDGEIGNELYRALEELRAAARSIRVMSEYLERHPEALLQGKGR